MSMVRRMRICDISQDEAAMTTRLTNSPGGQSPGKDSVNWDATAPEGRQPGKVGVKIAFATSGLQQVNQHFGSARVFAIYAVTAESAELLEAAEFGEQVQDGNENKLSAKIDFLEGCAAVYCEAVGASAIRQLIAAGIQPVKVYHGSVIAALLEDLRNELRTGPCAWLAKAIARQGGIDPSRFARMEAEGWDE